MSFTLLDLSSENFEFSANVWNWRTALEIIKSFDILSDGKTRQMEYNATGVKLEIEEAHLIGERIRAEILPKLEPNKRIFADLKHYGRARRRHAFQRRRRAMEKLFDQSRMAQGFFRFLFEIKRFSGVLIAETRTK